MHTSGSQQSPAGRTPRLLTALWCSSLLWACRGRDYQLPLSYLQPPGLDKVQDASLISLSQAGAAACGAASLLVHPWYTAAQPAHTCAALSCRGVQAWDEAESATCASCSLFQQTYRHADSSDCLAMLAEATNLRAGGERACTAGEVCAICGCSGWLDGVSILSILQAVSASVTCCYMPLPLRTKGGLRALYCAQHSALRRS